MIIDNVALTHLTFGQEFTSAIEAKQIALQQAEQAKYLVKQAEQDKLSTIIKAEVCFDTLSNPNVISALVVFLLKGEAESAKLIGEAIARDPGYIQVL